MPMAGVEPARSCLHQILSLARLPIPSHRHVKFSKLQQLKILKQKQIKISRDLFKKGYFNHIFSFNQINDLLF